MRVDFVVRPRQTIRPVIKPSDLSIQIAIKRCRTIKDLNDLGAVFTEARGVEFVCVCELQIRARDFDWCGFVHSNSSAAARFVAFQDDSDGSASAKRRQAAAA